MASSGWYSWPFWEKMPNCRNIPSIPKVRDSSATIGTTRLPIALSRSRVFSTRTNPIVVEFSRSPVPLSWLSNADSGGTSSGWDFGRRAGR